MATNRFVKSAAELESSQPPIDSLVYNRLMRTERDRDCDPIHASDLTKKDFCAREIWLRRHHEILGRERFIPAQLGWAFKFGDFLNDVLTNDILRDTIYGEWECDRCHHRYVGMAKDKCTKCANGRYKYREIVMTDAGLRVISSKDLFLAHNNALLMHEIKSMDKDEFRNIKAPLPEHQERTHLYMYLVRRNIAQYKALEKFLDRNYFYISYFCKCVGLKHKDTGKVTPVRTFKLKYDPKIAAPFVERARLVAGKTIPPPISEKRAHKHCRECTAKQLCLQLGG